MSEHAQALKLSTKVHSAFGDVLMLGGLTRIIEICFVVPSMDKEAPPIADSDRHSEQTLTGPNTVVENPRISIVQAFRHLPPFVSVVVNIYIYAYIILLTGLLH